MSYRDDLEAAQHRIKELEGRLEELQEAKESAPESPPSKKTSRSNRAMAFAFIGGGPVVIVLACIVFGGHACAACHSDVTDPALDALKKCPAAREVLGDDIGWSVVGCSNYESGTGGDPLNGGCHSSQDFVMPVSGTKGRGSYSFSASQPAGKRNTFNGGRVHFKGGSIGVNADGSCW